ncbi:MAG: TonB-dependent receptor [Bacteroidia bacterium]|nr:TonB-dependent receptor [Bacteroidia bacterium]MCZ2277928.1 TonB-dependent receptor [Bacteroidia bacterium]
MKKQLGLFFICVLLSAAVKAQQDTVWLKTAEITAGRMKLFAAGVRAESSDSLVQQLFAGESLSMIPFSPSLVVKDYGAGGIATASIRGMEARHTAVFWQGVPLRTASLGLTDLSLITAGPETEISLYKGSVTSLFHTSTSGGALILKERLPFNTALRAKVRAADASFGRRQVGVELVTGSDKLAVSTGADYLNSKNDFPYINNTKAGNPKERLAHAQENRFSAKAAARWQVNGGSELHFAAWYQFTNRNIPPMMIQNISRSSQKDSSFRVVIGWRKSAGWWSWQITSAWMDEHQRFDDSLSGIYSKNNNKMLFNEGAVIISLGRQISSRISVVYSHNEFNFREYNGRKYFDEWSLSNAWSLDREKFRSSISSRIMSRNGSFIPVSFSAGTNTILMKDFTLRASISKSVQLPTGNDLFWHPGGNPGLKAEHAFSAETGFDFNVLAFAEAAITAYQISVDNWIQWIPVSGGLYAPENIRKVNSRGIESIIKIPVQWKEFLFKTEFKYNFTKVVNRSSGQLLANDILHKQLIYIPESSYSVAVNLIYRDLTLWFYYIYTGLRFTTADHSYYLPANHLAYGAVSFNISGKNISVQPYLRVGNLFDFTYQIIPYHPMAGRSLLAGVKINFNHK